MSSERIDRPITWAQRCLTINTWLLVPLYLLIAVALWAAFLYAPTERIMGEVQRIFYFHVSAALISFLAFFFVFVGSVAYLITKDALWDTFAFASVEVGVLLTAIVMTTGPVWAKPVWNTWFPWGDPRIMTELVLLLIFTAYLILRSSMPDGEKKYKYCAVFGIIGALDVPIVHMSIRWWRTIHPVVITGSEVRLDPMMKDAWLIALVAYVVLTVALIALRMSMRLQRTATEELYEQLRDRRIHS